MFKKVFILLFYISILSGFKNLNSLICSNKDLYNKDKDTLTDILYNKFLGINFYDTNNWKVKIIDSIFRKFSDIEFKEYRITLFGDIRYKLNDSTQIVVNPIFRNINEQYRDYDTFPSNIYWACWYKDMLEYRIFNVKFVMNNYILREVKIEKGIISINDNKRVFRDFPKK